VLWTCREGNSLQEALERCEEIGLQFDAVNDNSPSQKKYMEDQKRKGEIFALRKIFADFYADDSAHNLDFFLKIDVEKTCNLPKYKNI
jgi:hypothetical protein